jgi:putative membrane protein
MSSEDAVSPAHRLHPVAMLIGALGTVRRWIGAAVVPGIVYLSSQGFGMGMLALLVLGFVVLAVLAGVWGFLAWRATTYAVAGGALRIKRGVLSKNERTIPLDRVQAVDTVQGLVQRLFGVVEVRIETAGGGNDPDASLSALGREAAARLRRELGGNRAASVVEEEATSGEIWRLSNRDLLIAGATSGRIGVALSVVAVASQVLDDLLPARFAERAFEALAPRSVTAVLVLIPAFALFAWLLAIAGTVLAYYGFTLSRDGDYLHIRRGLLERREATIPLARIQAVRISEGPLRQPFGLAMLRVESAGYGENAGVSTTLFPLLPRSEVLDFLAAMAPEFAVAPTLNRLPARARRRYILRAGLPFAILAAALGALALFPLDRPPLAALALLLLALAVPLGLLRYRGAGWSLEGDRLVVRSRMLALTTAIAPRRRLQSRNVETSPLQRRVRLATFEARIASGSGGASLSVTDLDASDASRLLENLGPRPA